MNRLLVFSFLVIATLTGCTTTPPPAGSLVLTEEDMRLKRTPYSDCTGACRLGEKVVYSK